MPADASELRAFAAELGTVPDSVVRKIRPVVSKGALNIRNQMRSEMQQSRSFKQIAPTINYDLNVQQDGMEAEIGPDKRRRAARLANIAYFGGANGGGGTVRDPARALEDEGDNFENALAKLLEGVL